MKMETSIKNKCVCELLRNQEPFIRYETHESMQNLEVLCSDKYNNAETSLAMEYYPTMNTWALSAYETAYAKVAINYCPFCGRKLTEE